MNHFTEVPDRTALRRFGLTFASILVLLFGLVIPLIRFGYSGLPLVSGSQNATWPWWVAGIISLFAVILPASLMWLYKPWMKFAELAQWVNTRIILLLLFYLVILPIGLLRKLLGKDSMQRKFDSRASSYRTVLGSADSNDMSKPY